MIEDNAFMGLGQAVWMDIFSLSKVLVPGLIMACFGAYYQSRKKTEIAIKIGITRLRIGAYNDIAAIFSKLAEQVSPSLADEAKVRIILDFYGYTEQNTDYSICIGSERNFDAFYDSICDVVRENEIYLDYKVKKQCTDAIGLFTELKQFLDAYCDVEGSQEKIDLAYRLTAIFMKNEINKASLLVCDVIAGQINGIRVTYLKYRMSKLIYRLIEPILRWADKNMNDASWKGWLSGVILSKALHDRLPLISKMPKLVEALAYVHVSDKYSAKAYFSMDENKRLRILSDFMQLYYVQLHHNR